MASPYGIADVLLLHGFKRETIYGPLAQLATRPNVPFGTGGERFRMVEYRLMYYAYILQDADGKLYKGVTNNIVRRFREHNSGHTKTTKKMRGLKVIYTEAFNTFQEARAREKYFKTAAGRKFIKTNIMGR